MPWNNIEIESPRATTSRNSGLEDPELTDPEHAALRTKREAYLTQMEANLVL